MIGFSLHRIIGKKKRFVKRERERKRALKKNFRPRDVELRHEEGWGVVKGDQE